MPYGLCRASAAFFDADYGEGVSGPFIQSKLLPRRGCEPKSFVRTGSLRYEDGAKGEKGEKKGEARTRASANAHNELNWWKIDA